MEIRMNEVTERIRQQTKELCFAALTPKSSGTLFNSAVLTALMNETGDIKIWNSGETATNTKALKKLPPFFTQFLSRMQAANGSEKPVLSILKKERSRAPSVPISARKWERSIRNIHRNYFLPGWYAGYLRKNPDAHDECGQ